jgi:hypothetical protein
MPYWRLSLWVWRNVRKGYGPAMRLTNAGTSLPLTDRVGKWDDEAELLSEVEMVCEGTARPENDRIDDPTKAEAAAELKMVGYVQLLRR